MRSCSMAFVLLMASIPPAIAGSDAAASGVADFNRALTDATRRMDNAAVLALWEDDGVSLLPETPPISGKPAIGKFLREATAPYPAAHMVSFDMQCHDVAADGALATEWCDEHQVVHLKDGQADFDGRGRMLFVLHLGTDGHWRLRREMWQPAPTQHAPSNGK